MKENQFWKFINRKRNSSNLLNAFEYSGIDYNNSPHISEVIIQYSSNSYTKLKIQINETVIRQIVLHGCETWTLMKSTKKNLGASNENIRSNQDQT